MYRILIVLQICSLCLSGSCQLLQALHDIRRQHNFDTIFWLNHRATTCFGTAATAEEDVLKRFVVPKLIATDSTTFVLKQHFNTKILSIACLNDYNDLGQLVLLQRNLRGISTKHIIILLKTRVANYSGLQELFTTCYHRQQLSVLVLLNDFHNSQCYYSYRPFPTLTVEKRAINLSHYFPATLSNLRGYPLLTYPDQLQPRTLLHHNTRNGQLEMIGYVGRLLVTYAQHINATLKWAYPVQLGSSVFFTDIVQMARNRTLDIAASIAIVNGTAADFEFSRFIEIGKWFPMLPVAEPLPLASIYAQLFTSPLAMVAVFLYFVFSMLLTLHDYNRDSKNFKRFYLQLIINEKAFLSLIGGSVPCGSGGNNTPRSFMHTDQLLFMLLFVAGLSVTTTFNTLLSSLRTRPPFQPELNSLADLKLHNLKVFQSGGASKLMGLYAGPEAHDYGKLVHFHDNLTEFIRLRNSFNKSMAFGTTSALWSVHERQQRYFARQLFRVSPQVYFNNFMLYALPLPADSIYAASLNRFIAQLHASGIFEQWYQSSFFDMITVGLMSFRDLSVAPGFEVARVADFYWVWILFCFGNAVSCVVFLTELFTYCNGS